MACGLRVSKCASCCMVLRLRPTGADRDSQKKESSLTVRESSNRDGPSKPFLIVLNFRVSRFYALLISITEVDNENVERR